MTGGKHTARKTQEAATAEEQRQIVLQVLQGLVTAGTSSPALSLRAKLPSRSADPRFPLHSFTF